MTKVGPGSGLKATARKLLYPDPSLTSRAFLLSAKAVSFPAYFPLGAADKEIPSLVDNIKTRKLCSSQRGPPWIPAT